MGNDTLYYDGACPLCSAEIRKLAKFADSGLSLQDIHQLDSSDASLDKAVLLSLVASPESACLVFGSLGKSIFQPADRGN